jgi:hypothetical protein
VSHALLWHGSADSAIDLHPAGFDSSQATGVWGETQVGSGVLDTSTNAVGHALLWRGSAESVVDLHPPGYHSSGAAAVARNFQIGGGVLADGGVPVPLVWNGTAQSAVDLNQFLVGLPVHFSFTVATGVDESGNVVGLAIGPQGPVPILWTLVPEPAALPLLLSAAIAIVPARQRFKGGRNVAVLRRFTAAAENGSHATMARTIVRFRIDQCGRHLIPEN